MGDDVNAGNGGGAHWTVETLLIHLGCKIAEVREHILAIIVANDLRYDQRFEAYAEQVRLALASAKDAITKAEAAQEKRMDSLNELRDMATDAQKLFATKSDMEVIHVMLDGIKEQMDVLRGQKQGSVGASANLVVVISLIIAAITLLSRFLIK